MQTMDTTPPPADTQETGEYQTVNSVSTASNDSFPCPMKYFKSPVKSQTKTTTSNFIFENPFSIFQKEKRIDYHDIRHFNCTVAKEETPNCHYIKINYLNVLKGLYHRYIINLFTTTNSIPLLIRRRLQDWIQLLQIQQNRIVYLSNRRGKDTQDPP
jgi:hypothetical protein